MLFSTANHFVSNLWARLLFSIAFDSAALAEKLLNDMLKATEAFNKLKKINDDLK